MRGLTEQIEHMKASIRAAVEHPFRVVKQQFGHVKARYRGLAKNGAPVLTLFALSTPLCFFVSPLFLYDGDGVMPGRRSRSEYALLEGACDDLGLHRIRWRPGASPGP